MEIQQGNATKGLEKLDRERGRILIKMINLEDYIDNILSLVYTEGNERMAKFINKSLLKTSVTLNNKIRLLKDLNAFENLGKWGTQFNKDFFKKLDRLKVIRNMFAHKTNLGHVTKEKVTVFMYISKKKKLISELISEFNNLHVEVDLKLEKTLIEIEKYYDVKSRKL